MYACVYVCDRFANSHTRFCTIERNDRFYVCSGLSRDALAIILNAASTCRYPTTVGDGHGAGSGKRIGVNYFICLQDPKADLDG